MSSPMTIIQAFENRKVLVIGDAILDVYEKGGAEKLCREAPAPVVTLQERVFSCGGAANTAVNTAALGGKVSFASVIGNDENGNRLIAALEEGRVDTRLVVRTTTRRSIAKTRVCASSSILVRVDEGDTAPIDRDIAATLAAQLRDHLPCFDVVILSDYGYGTVSEELLAALREIPQADMPPLVVDARDPARFHALRPAAVKPNYTEAMRLLQQAPRKHGERIEQILAHGAELLEKTGAEFVAATLDMDGTVLLEKNQPPYLVSCLPQPDKKTIGAGDSFVGAMALAIAAGASPKLATRLGAAAAAVVIRKDGTGICSRADLRACFRGDDKRISSVETLARRIRDLKREKRRIVFTNGCFDILHRGHVDFLNQAKALGDVLVVALNSDAGIRRIKGDGRPVNALEDRMEVLAGLQAVDLLIAFDDESPANLIEAVKPHVFAKGGTYSVDSLPEAELVRALGGEVEIVPFRSQLSTSRLIEKIQHAGKTAKQLRSGQRAL